MDPCRLTARPGGVFAGLGTTSFYDDTDAFDTTSLGSMSQDVSTLALAYFFTDDPRYAQHAAKWVRAWFIDPATRAAWAYEDRSYAAAAAQYAAAAKESVISVRMPVYARPGN